MLNNNSRSVVFRDNGNNFNQFSSLQQRDTSSSINAPYSPQNIASNALRQTPFNGAIQQNSSSNCMQGYNPHNAMHEYHVANGGCVSDANKAEAKVAGKIISTVNNPYVATAIGMAATQPCNTLATMGPYGSALSVGCHLVVGANVGVAVHSIGVAATQAEKIAAARSVIQSIVEQEFAKDSSKVNIKEHSGYRAMHKYHVNEVVLEEMKHNPILQQLDQHSLCLYTDDAVDRNVAGYTPDSSCILM
jgi:hypothetical protein